MRDSDDGLIDSTDALLASIVESSDDAILSKDTEGRITSWNAAAERLYGYTREEAVGRPISMLAPPESNGEIESILDRVMRGERVDHFETVRVRKDGAQIDVSVTVSPIRDGSGAIAGASVIAREIGERKQTERRMAELLERVESANERFELAASAVTSVIYEWDLDTNEVIRTRGLLDVVGFSPEDVRPSVMWWNARIHPDDLVRVRDYMASALDHAATFAIEYRVLHRNEVYVHVWDQGVIVRDGDGRPVRIVGNTQNVSERKRAEEDRDRLLVREQHARREAEEASRIKDEFLATVSHELRTPLNAILGWSRMLAGGGLDETTFGRGVEAVQRNTLSLTELVNDLLDVSRIISGNLRLDVRAVELPGVVQTAIDSVRPSADAKGIRLQAVLDPRAGPVLGDPERLQQVVWNLLSNAIKFTPKGGRVQIQLQRINSHVEIVVSDTGVGINGEFLPYVFDRFRQADASITRKHGGLGLGLSIVRHLVELHGGVVHAESEGVDAGATFSVRLPVMVLRREPSDPTRVHPAVGGDVMECPPSLAGLHVVVVDDEPDTNEILALILKQCDAEVEKCASAAEALEAFDRGRIDVLISDIGMADMDGYELIRRVRMRAADRGGRVPAIALTAFARVEDRVRALSAGFQAHVGKPVEPAELLAVVASLAGRSGGDSGAE